MSLTKSSAVAVGTVPGCGLAVPGTLHLVHVSVRQFFRVVNLCWLFRNVPAASSVGGCFSGSFYTCLMVSDVRLMSILSTDGQLQAKLLRRF